MRASPAEYLFIINATNGVSPAATQPFTLTVNQAPAITSTEATATCHCPQLKKKYHHVDHLN